MSATLPLRARRRWILWALCALAGCSNGVVEPIVAPVTADAGERDAQPDADAATDEDHDHRGRPVCEDIDWPENATSSENTLLGIVNALRGLGPPELCPSTTDWGWWPLRSNSELRCVARQRASQHAVADGAEGADDPPIWKRNSDVRDIYDREERAGLRRGTVRLELLIADAESPEEIRDQLRADPGDACSVGDPALQSVGIVQRGNFWALDFAGGGGRRP